ncbi:hypothetical protein Trco_003073 [Trichoderma cornu-damae]|uniref:BRCT domain-containing protein n=1 Tax=Trichoderma cornu-damae TaxID=654480 RepID=A0A9P8TZ61_9HYPO|nr:hypothetical protein Trco_003073 [Trichoderma cornu-damae]
MSPPPKAPKAPLSRITATRRPWDPWNSSATGHQRAETQPGTAWRRSRNRKLNSQFRAGDGDSDGSAGRCLGDVWGVGAEDPGGKTRGPSGEGVMDMLARPGLMGQTLESCRAKGREMEAEALTKQQPGLEGEGEGEGEGEAEEAQDVPQKRKLFDGVTVYVNGSTFPLVSDHRLKQLISENGGTMSLHLGRRRVTHVILGRQNGSGQGKGAGGGLAAGKLEKEIRKMGGCGVQFVSVEWVLESLKEGKRLPEARFSTLKIAPKAQNSVFGLYSRQHAVSTTAQRSPAPP